MLEDHGYRVVGVGDVAGANAYLHGDAQSPCLVLLGVSAPNLDGYELRDDRARAALDTDVPIATISRHARRFPSREELIRLVEQKCVDDPPADDESSSTRS